MTFKKAGTDPITTRPNSNIMGLTFIGAAFALLGIGLPAPLEQAEGHPYRRYPSRNKQPRRKLKRNLVTHSRRIRRKHRRARAA